MIVDVLEKKSRLDASVQLYQAGEVRSEEHRSLLGCTVLSLNRF